MQIKAAKKILIAVVLLQGVNSPIEVLSMQTEASALQQSARPQIKSLPNQDANFLKKERRHSAIEIVQNQNQGPSHKNKKNLDSLKSYINLDLPKKPSEVRVEKLYSLTLQDIDKLVEINNPKIIAMRSKLNQARSLLKEALAAWYPNINLLANGLPQYLEGSQSNNTGPDTSSKQWKSSVSVEVKWDLIDPSRSPEIAAAKDRFEKEYASYLITLRDLRLNAVSEYFSLQKSNEGVRIGKQSVQASQISLKDAQSRFEAGVGTKLEVLEAKNQLARDQQLLVSKQGETRINQRKLAEILNLPLKVSPSVSSTVEILGAWKATLQESIIAAYAFRKELERLKLDISINNSNANSALASSQPTISLINTLSSSYSEGELLAKEPDMNKSNSSVSNTISLNARWNIFDGGKARARYNYNKEKAKEAEANFSEKRNLIRREVEESFFKLETAAKEISSAKSQIIASTESLRLARLRFQAGVTNQREVVNNQRDVTEAEVRYTDAITSYNKSLAQLQRQTGINELKSCQSKRVIIPNKSESPLQEMYNDESLPILPLCEEKISTK